MIFGNRYLHELSINGNQVTDDKGFADEDENQNDDQQQNQNDGNDNPGTDDTATDDPTVNNDEPDEFEKASAAGDTGEENPEPDNTDEPTTQDDQGDTGVEDTPDDPTATEDEPDEFDLANGEDNPDDGGDGENPDAGGEGDAGEGEDPTANNDEPDEFEQASAAGDTGGDNPDDGGGDGTDDGGDNPEDGGNQDGTGDEGGIDSEIDNLEKQLFGNLTDEQLKVKSLELKSNYKKLYTVCDDIITKVGEIPKTAESAEIIKRIINIASDLKEYIESYMLYNFGNNSLPENMIMFKKYLVILNGIKKCLAELEKNTVDINNKNKLNESMMFLEGLKLISV